jgi:hypothetical protein
MTLEKRGNDVTICLFLYYQHIHDVSARLRLMKTLEKSGNDVTMTDVGVVADEIAGRWSRLVIISMNDGSKRDQLMMASLEWSELHSSKTLGR